MLLYISVCLVVGATGAMGSDDIHIYTLLYMEVVTVSYIYLFIYLLLDLYTALLC